MPAFSQEELDRFAHLDATERHVREQQAVRDGSVSEFRGEVGGIMNGVEMKTEHETELQELPVEETEHQDDRADREDTNEEFVEAAEEFDAPEPSEPRGRSREPEPEPQPQPGPEPDTDTSMVDIENETIEAEQTNHVEVEEAEKMDVDISGSGSESLQVSSDGEEGDEGEEEKGDEEVEDEEVEDEEAEKGDNDNDDDPEDEEEEEDSDSDSDGAVSDNTESSGSTSDNESESSSEDDDDDPEEESSEKDCPYCKLSVTQKDPEDLDSLKCKDCDAHAHERCVRDNGKSEVTEDSAMWQCPDCAQTQTPESLKEAARKNKNSAPRLVRDLLPVSRGVQKPNSHSIFNQPLISEGEDGGRALRKRKSPTVEPPVSEKRRRKATPKAMSASLPDDNRVESVTHATRRASQKTVPTARILQYRPYEKAPPHKFILAFRLDQSKIEKILSKPSRPTRQRDRRRPPKIQPPPIFQPPVPKFPALPTNHLIFPSMWGDRENEANAKPYGGILGDAEADTSRSLPQLKDRELFEIARKEAEEERRRTSAAAEAEINGENTNTTKPNRTVSGPPSKIKCIQFGKYVIDTFYAAPYPEEYSHESRLFICEFCLKYLPSEFVAYRHKLKCPAKHPPGDEIYRDGTISIWEVDGRKKTEYCQCLCLMAKMFLGSKTLYYDVEPFLFYILTEYDEFGYHFVGYFSKEKRPASQNNVSCILVMPIHQRKGYATFLIDFSYLLTRIEGKDGSPEKPLSDMGLTAYRSYWDLTVARQLLDIGMKPFSTKDLMQRTGMTADDVVHSLERLYAFVKDPVTKTYAIRYDQQLYENVIHEFESKKHRTMKPENLIWTPYIMGRSDQAHLDTQPVQAIAPREGDEIAVTDSQSPSKNGEMQDNTDIEAHEEHHPAAQESGPVTNPLLINGVGNVAPGPPSAQLLTGPVTSDDVKVEPHLNGVNEKAPSEEPLTGYALAYRDHKIPPNRFQIDPPIPASMLRARSHKKRNTGFGRVNANGGKPQSPSMAPVRSSPRHASSVNGSVNGVNDGHSPEKPSTPIRRSSRKSGLSNMEMAGLDGSIDQDEDEQSIGDEIEAKLDMEEEESASGSSSDEVEELSVDDDGEDDEDAEIPDDEDEDEDEDDEEGEDEDPDALDIAAGSEEEESDND